MPVLVCPASRLYVVKRDGTWAPVKFSRIVRRLTALATGLESSVDIAFVATQVIHGLKPGITTQELDILAAKTCGSLVFKHPDYSILAARIELSNLEKNTDDTFTAFIQKAHSTGVLSEQFYLNVVRNADKLDSLINHNYDSDMTYFAFKTLESFYLMKDLQTRKTIERPQYLLMRVAVTLYGTDLVNIENVYNLMGQRYFTHASPTLFNAGLKDQQLTSCFLLGVGSKFESCVETVKNCLNISHKTGGIGIEAHDVPAKGGLVQTLQLFNNISKCSAAYIQNRPTDTIDNSKRPGTIAVYLEPWHEDVYLFLELRKNIGAENMRTRDLFTALWVPDLFMKCVKNDLDWTLFNPIDVPKLSSLYGYQFEVQYTVYCETVVNKRVVKAQHLWRAILNSQIETGLPYMLYKDACNEKSNHKEIGTIKNSNLCAEIIEYSNENEHAACTLASIAVNKFFETGHFNFVKFEQVVRVVTRNLNKILDLNVYPTEGCKELNVSTLRPIGIGVQGLADLFMLMKYPFESDEAKFLNKQIFESIYFASLMESCKLARDLGQPYKYFNQTPMSKGILQFDLWKITDKVTHPHWSSLKKLIMCHGVRNSLLTACMPTASTAQILGNNESFEPITSNLYIRRTNAGEFQMINKYLVNDLINLNMWDGDMINQIIKNNGSIQNIDKIPMKMKKLYKTVWEIKQKQLLKMSADRGQYIDQSQSLNAFFVEPTISVLTSYHFYGWELGLKTGMYYLRSKPAANAIQFIVEKNETKECMQCSG
jgi:ribonucleoside-diphosphate reductase alpha subunit